MIYHPLPLFRSPNTSALIPILENKDMLPLIPLIIFRDKAEKVLQDHIETIGDPVT